jgi:heme oxygenase
MTGGHLNPTELKLDSILADKGDDLTPIESTPNGDEPNLPTPDATPTPDAPVGDGDVTPPIPDASEPAPTDGERFTANEIAKEETPEEPAPLQPADPEAKYIVDNLPEISTRIMQDGKPVDVTVKSWTQLPDDVEFATKRDELAFMNSLTAQENRARELQNTYRQEQTQSQVNEFEQRENAAINEDLTRLQNEDKLPKLLAPDDPKFADDPSTKEVQTVLDYMNEKNAEYLDRYNKGSAYRHIGFEEAFNMMPKTQEANTRSQRQTQEDGERQQRAGRISGNTGTDNKPVVQRPTVQRGISLDQIVERVENEW